MALENKIEMVADFIESAKDFFIDLLLNDKENLENPPESAYKTVKLVELLRESADNGAVTLPVNY